MAALQTDSAVLAKEAANFERIAGELKDIIARVERTANELDSHWQGAAAKAAQGAIDRFHQAASAQVQQLNEISTNIQTAGSQYAGVDNERAGALASAMSMGGPNAGDNMSTGGAPMPQPAVNNGGRHIQMAGHGFKADSPPPPTPSQAAPAQGAQTPGGAPGAANRPPPGMRTAPPTVVGPGAAKPDPSMHDGTKWDLAQDTGKVLAGAGALVGLPELAGGQGILSIGDPPTDDAVKAGGGLKAGLGAVGGLLGIQSGLDDAAHTNVPGYKPDIITEIFGDPQRGNAPQFGHGGDGTPTQ
jgi:WXG100 family type VII secretion target